MSMPQINNSGITQCEAIADIIESIALMEAGLCHILNAEGEKIQAAIGTLTEGHDALAQNTQELLDLNSSVLNLISSITLLEDILEKKLSLALSVNCPSTISSNVSKTT